ncbi:sensor histidine kinase [Thalassotalea euphylliae]|uniref:sensor histidine kinase n=1 Tax=Thalassotalea euphylliae TaxID=1655234 RepID=UPI00364447AA
MFKSLIENLPSRYFWLGNIVFWLLLNSLAATNSYRMNLHFNRQVDWLDVWLEYLPWWGNWALIAPLIIASTQMISFDGNSLHKFIAKTLAVMMVFFCFYWSLTIVEVSLISEGTLSISALRESFAQLMLSPLHMDFLVYIAVLCSGYSYTYYTRSRQQSKRNRELSEQLLQVELQSLKSQLNPHFLFNTLNTIASLIRLDNKPNAIKALSELSSMLRKVLENQRHQLISLKQEMEFIESYLIIQRMRFENKLTTQVNVDPNCLTLDVPFMLLQPLVENAVQHGSQLESNKNELRLDVYCQDDYLHVKLINKIPEKDEHQGFGIGLSNCRKRLEKLYEYDFQLTLTPMDNGYFETYLCLPIGVLDA